MNSDREPASATDARADSDTAGSTESRLPETTTHDAKRRRPTKPVPTLATWLLPSFHHLTLLLLLSLLLTDASRFLSDSDTGWHIRTGGWIRQHHVIPRHDLFSFTMPDQEWFAWEWLTDVLMSLLHSAFGLAGLTGASVLLLTFTYWWLCRRMISSGTGPLMAGALALFAAMASIVHWLARPHLISITLMLCWCVLVEIWRSHRREAAGWRRHAIWMLPPLTALWANLHGAFAVTFVMLLIYFAGEFMEALVRGELRHQQTVKALRTYVLVAAASLLASLLNPYGVRLYQHLWQYLTDREMLARIDEFQPPDFQTVDGKLILVLLSLAIIAGLSLWRQRRFTEIGLLGFWSYLTLQSERHVTLAVIVLMPIIAGEISVLLARFGALIIRQKGAMTRWYQGVLAWYCGTLQIERQLRSPVIPATVFLFICLLTSGRLNELTEKLLKPHFNARRLPVAAADFIASGQLEGNGYAPDQFGGYLIYRFWPLRRVFLDGRSDFYRTGTVFDEALRLHEAAPDWRELLDKYQVQWLLLRRDDALSKAALAEGNWTSIYHDDTAQLLIRKSNPDKKIGTR
jgi:hypothetical protein